MSMTFYYGSGSPYGWRIWFALEHKQLPYALKLLSFSAGDLTQPAFLALNPRGRVPVLVDGDFCLYESGAILEYLEDRYPSPRLFPDDVRARALARRLIREAEHYLALAMEKLVDGILFTQPEQWNNDAIGAARAEFAEELRRFEDYTPAADFLAGTVGAADFTLYPMIALALRMQRRKPDLDIASALGPRLSAWMKRVEALPYFDNTFPPHWRPQQ